MMYFKLGKIIAANSKFSANTSEMISSILSYHNGIKLETKSNMHNFVEVEQHIIE